MVLLPLRQNPSPTTILIRICVACHQKFRTDRPGITPCPHCGQRLTLVYDSYHLTPKT